jgi:hypothetical protein
MFPRGAKQPSAANLKQVDMGLEIAKESAW